MPDQLRRQAQDEAAEHGLSLAEYMRGAEYESVLKQMRHN